MKILLFTLELPPATNGIATFDGELASGLLEAGHEVLVFTTQPSAACAPRSSGEPVWINLAEAHASTLADVRHLLPFEDAVVAHYVATGLVYAEWLRAHASTLAADLALVPDFGGIGAFLRPLPCPLVVICHCLHDQLAAHDPRPSPGARILSALEFDALTRADALVALGEVNARDIRARAGRPVGVASLPLPPAAFEHRRSDVDESRVPRGFVVGRLDPYRGAETVARALEMLRAQGVSVAVDWYGSDVPGPDGSPMTHQLEKEFPSVWDKSLRWHPPLPRDKLALRRAAADFAIVASRWETFSYAAIEAMAAGLPCILSEGAGVAGWVRPGEDALTFPPGDADRLAVEMRRLVDSAGTRRRIGAAARARARETFTRAIAVEGILGQARTLLGAPAAPRRAPATLAALALPELTRNHVALRRQRAEVTSTRQLLRLLARRAFTRLRPALPDSKR